jgi:hypothetical protein
MLKKIIISPSYGHFEPDKRLKKIIEECGHKSLWELKARMDARIIKFIEDRTHKQGREVQYVTKNEFGDTDYITIDSVDTSRLWTIDEYDGSEGIVYLEIVDKELNFCKFKYNW